MREDLPGDRHRAGIRNRPRRRRGRPPTPGARRRIHGDECLHQIAKSKCKSKRCQTGHRRRPSQAHRRNRGRHRRTYRRGVREGSAPTPRGIREPGRQSNCPYAAERYAGDETREARENYQMRR